MRVREGKCECEKGAIKEVRVRKWRYERTSKFGALRSDLTDREQKRN